MPVTKPTKRTTSNAAPTPSHAVPGTLTEILRRHAVDRPLQPALRFVSATGSAQTLNYRELVEKSQAIAGELRKHVIPGDRALLFFESGPEFLVAFLGCLEARVIAVSAFPPSESRDIKRLFSIIEDSSASVILTTRQIDALIQDSKARSKLSDLSILHVEEVPTRTPGLKDSSELPSPKDIALLQYTSGSTGQPRGVVLSQSNLVANLGMIHTNYRTDEETTWVSWLPLFHDMGLIGGALSALYCGGTSVLMAPHDFLRNPSLWLKLISEHNGTVTGAPNFAYDLLNRRIEDNQLSSFNLSSLKVVFNGAEPVRSETMVRFASKFSQCGLNPKAILPTYGLAEATLMVSGGPAGQGLKTRRVSRKKFEVGILAEPESPTDAKELVSCGALSPATEVRIINPATGADCLAQEVGEIWVKGPLVSEGYWNKESETHDTFRSGYLRTGDLGFLYENELYPCGRIKDIIILHGRNYYPQDLEHLLEKTSIHLRKGCSVAFSVELRSAESVCIVAEIKKDTPKGEYPKLSQGIQSAIQTEFGLPVGRVALVAERTIPKTSSGKLQRLATKHLLENQEIVPLFDSIAPTGELTPGAARDAELQDLIRQQKERLAELEALHAAVHQPIPTPGPSILSTLTEILAKKLDVPSSRLDPDADLRGFGIDSVIAYEFYCDIIEKFEAKIPRRVVYEYPTLKSIADLIQGQGGKSLGGS